MGSDKIPGMLRLHIVCRGARYRYIGAALLKSRDNTGIGVARRESMGTHLVNTNYLGIRCLGIMRYLECGNAVVCGLVSRRRREYGMMTPHIFSRNQVIIIRWTSRRDDNVQWKARHFDVCLRGIELDDG